MLYWTVIFFIISIVAAIFGFGGISESTADIAKVLFVVFLIVTIISFFLGRRGRGV